MDTMKSYYMPIDYLCNHKCSCCPCSKEQREEGFIKLDLLKAKADELKKNSILDITISGGEPTLHPGFLELIKYLLDLEFKIHLLTNSDGFGNDDFLNKFVNVVGNNKHQLFITTTIHSYQKENYESQTLVKDSYDRVIKGLKSLNKLGFNLSIKQCITKNNFLELTDYVKFIFNTFNDEIEIQFWGIDYCGIPLEIANNFYLDYKDLKKPLEDALDYFLKHRRSQSISINNIPLCCVDMYYWNLFSLPNIESYVEKDDFNEAVSLNYGTYSRNCKRCYLRKYCRGAYKTTFEIFGDDIVSEPKVIEKLFNRIPIYHIITEKNYDKLFWSNKLLFKISTNGLIIINKKNSKSITLKLKESQLITLYDYLEKGIDGKSLEVFLNICFDNGTNLYYHLVKSGVVV